MNYGLCSHCGQALVVGSDGQPWVPECCTRGRLEFVRLFLLLVRQHVKHELDTRECDYFASGFDNVDDALEQAITAFYREP